MKKDQLKNNYYYLFMLGKLYISSILIDDNDNEINIDFTSNIDYAKIPNLASEARQKLMEINPTTIGQASRISGVNPADISILMVYLRKNGQNE